MQDEIIRVLFDFVAKHLYPAQNPSEAEHMAVVATGGCRRGVLAAGSRHRSALSHRAWQTAWASRSPRPSSIACGTWDSGRPRHPLRRRKSRQAKADMTIRTGILEARYLWATTSSTTDSSPASTRRSCRGPRPDSSPPNRRARGTSPAGGPVAIWSSPTSGQQGRSARPAHALLDRQIRLSCARARRAHRARRLRPARIPEVSPLRRFSLGGALPHALSDRTRRGAALVRYPTRDRGAARLHRASGLARRRALHEALLLDR